MSNNTCIICSQGIKSIKHQDGFCHYNCNRCGNFKTTRETIEDHLSNLSPYNKVLLWGSIRNQNNSCVLLDSAYLNNIKNTTLPTIVERSNYLLLFFYNKLSSICDKIRVDGEMEESCIGISWSQDKRELRYLMLEYLSKENLINIVNKGHTIDDDREIKFQFTPKGHEQIYQIKNDKTKRKKAFVAMKFDDALRSKLQQYIFKAITEVGFEPVMSDSIEHNEKIDDKILFDIRNSRFIVSDFTLQNQGVYFETGFARGLNIDVIWTCHKDELKNMHFDIRQFNCITWDENELIKFCEKLTNRIKETII